MTVLDPLVAQIESTPLCAAVELPESLTAVEGRALAEALLESPVSGVSVIGYRVIVDVRYSDGQRRFDIARINDFDVEDSTGRVHVSATGAVLLLQHEYAQESGEGGSISASVLRLINDRADVEWLRRVPDSFTWHEYFLEAREPVYVCGEGRRVVDPSREPIHYRQSALQPTIARPSSGALIVGDLHREELLRALRASWSSSSA
jgi:hypothetical protein